MFVIAGQNSILYHRGKILRHNITGKQSYGQRPAGAFTYPGKAGAEQRAYTGKTAYSLQLPLLH